MSRRGVRRSRTITVLGVAAGLLLAGVVPAVATPASPAAAAAVAAAPGTFTALPPTRVLDTRKGLGAALQPVARLGTVHLQVTGNAGVPSSGVAAVLLNVTVTDTRGAGYITAYPDGQTRPTASNLNFVAGTTVPNLVAVRVGAGGAVALYNGSGGTADLIADVAGYYAAGAPSVPGAFASLPPTRVLDTRNGTGAPRAVVPATGTATLQVAGRGGVPASGVAAVLLNVTVTNARGSGYVTAYPSGRTRPTASNLNFDAGRTIANLVAVPVGVDGRIALFNGSGGTTDLVADVAGWYRSGPPVAAGAFVSLPPTRTLDTRSGLGGRLGAVAAGGTVHLAVGGRTDVPSSGVSAVLLNVTVTNARGTGYVTVYPDDSTRPTASNLNFVAGRTVANLVSVRVGPGGTVALYNGSGGPADLVADVAGYVRATAADTTPPAPVADVRITGITARSVSLAWTNPADADFVGVVIRRAVGPQPPTTPTSGTAVVDTTATTFTDGGLAADATYSYALFAHDEVPNYATAATITAATAVGPTGAVVNLGAVDWIKDAAYGYNWADPDVVHEYPAANGRLGVATYHPADDAITAQTFDPATHQQIGATVTRTTAGWPIWGGLYAAPTGDFYVALGKDNPNEDDHLNVVAIRHYDADWTLLGTAYVQGGATQGGIKGIYSPFDAGAPHMVLVGTKLVLHMSRLIYAIDDVHHQVNLTVEIDVPTMTASTFDDLQGRPAYSSHSFQQLVAMSGTSLVTIDHGDAYPRGVQLGVYANYPNTHTAVTTTLLPFNDETGNNYTGATVTGLISGGSGVVVVGNSIVQPAAAGGSFEGETEMRNVYAVAADPATGAHTLSWLTAFAPHGSQQALQPRVVQVAADRWAVLFTVLDAGVARTEYRLLDSAGTVRASAIFAALPFSAGTDPAHVGNAIYWTGRDSGGTGYVYGLDVSDPTQPHLITS